MPVHFNTVAGERRVWSLTGNTMFPLSTMIQQLMTCSANIAIQTSFQSVPSTPTWFGEVVIVATHLAAETEAKRGFTLLFLVNDACTLLWE